MSETTATSSVAARAAVASIYLASIVFIIVCFVLFGVYYTSRAECTAFSDQTLLNKSTSPLCQDCNPCTQAILTGQGQCLFQQRTEGSACISDQCYVAGAATTSCQCGQCVGNFMECKGYCQLASDCPMLPLSPNVLPGIVTEEGDNRYGPPAGQLPVYYTQFCIANSCVYKLTNIYQAEPRVCAQYLDTNDAQVKQGCLNDLLNNDLNASSFYINCVFQYNCAINQIDTKRK